MAYTPQTWINGSAGGTFFVNGPHLQHIEDGIEDADNRLTALEAAPGTPDASGSVKGKVQLTGDLGGTAASPTVPGLAGKASASALASHVADSGNPHSVTAAQVGLGSASNTSDANKPVSTAQQAALDTKLSLSTVTTKGDLIVATGAGAVTRLPVTIDGQSPVSDSTQPGGWKLATPAGAGSGITAAQAVLLSSYIGI